MCTALFYVINAFQQLMPKLDLTVQTEQKEEDKQTNKKRKTRPNRIMICILKI